MEIRFHLDENVPAAVASALRNRGIDVSTTPEQGLLGADDPVHLEFALHDGRVIFTQDADFLRLHTAGAPHAGIVYGQQDQCTIGSIVRMLVLLYECSTMEDMRGRVEYL